MNEAQKIILNQMIDNKKKSIVPLYNPPTMNNEILEKELSTEEYKCISGEACEPNHNAIGSSTDFDCPCICHKKFSLCDSCFQYERTGIHYYKCQKYDP